MTDSNNPAAPLPRPSRRLAKPRIDCVELESASAEQREILEQMRGRSGRVYNIFRTLAQHPDLARDWLVFAAHVLRRNSLPERDREILILRIGWLCGSEYEWVQHVRIARRSGLGDEDFRTIAGGADSGSLSEMDRLLIRAVDELHRDAFLSDATWRALSQRYDARQMLDLVFTVGQYNMLAMALNSLGVQVDEGL